MLWLRELSESQMVRCWKDVIGKYHYRLTLFLYSALSSELLFTGVENRPLVPPVYLFLCASVGGGELASHGNNFLWLVEEGKWFSVPQPWDGVQQLSLSLLMSEFSPWSRKKYLNCCKLTIINSLQTILQLKYSHAGGQSDAIWLYFPT